MKIFKEYKISELGDVVGGGTPSTINEAYWNGDIPWISPKDLTDYNSVYIDHGENYITGEGLKGSATQLLPANSVLFSSRAPIGYIALAKKPICTNQGFKSIICDTSKIVPLYLYYYIKANLPYFKNFGSGATFPEISGSVMKKIKINIFVDIQYQHSIANILYAFDNLIEINNKRIKVLEQMAENLYKEWFVRFRFPGYETTEFGNGIPKGWKYINLNHLFDVRYGKDHKGIADGVIPVFGSGGIMRYGDRSIYEGETVLIPRKGSLNNIMYFNGEFWTVDTMFYTVPLKDNFAKYAYYTLSKFDMESYNSGAALPSMTTDILYHLRMLVPDEATLSAFDRVVSDIFIQKDLLIKANEKLIKQRDLLLPRLMSGKLEV